MNVFFVGGTGQARLCHHILQKLGHQAPYMFDRTKGMKPPWDCFLFDDETLISQYAKRCEGFIVCIGGEHGERRAHYSEQLLELGLTPVSAVHPTAFLGETVGVGRGLQAMPHAVVNEFAQIGDWCILNTNCTVDHDCRIGNGVHIMGGASLAGEIVVEDFATIGTNATILPRLTIGRNSYVGAGAVVTKNVPENTVVVGVPARAMGSRKSGMP